MQFLSLASCSLIKFKKRQYILALHLVALLLSFSLNNSAIGSVGAAPNLSLKNQSSPTGLPSPNNKLAIHCPSLCSGLASHTTTLLANGKILLAGGDADSGILNASKLYDQTSGTWSPTGNLTTPRYYHSATLLTNGKVLVAGGAGSNSSGLASSELYDPATGTWSPTGNLNASRYSHTATLLANGKVLVVGGVNSSGDSVTTGELYDPTTGTWSSAGSLSVARIGHTATLLPNGKVLVVGSLSPYTAVSELYDPAIGAWLPTGSLAGARSRQTATLLPNGKVLVAGGFSAADRLILNSELYDPATGNWESGGKLTSGRYSHTATLLGNGKVVVTGGNGDGIVLNNTEIYDPATKKWTPTNNLANPRYSHTATLLTDGQILLVGGITNNGKIISTSEIYDPTTGDWLATGSLANARTKHTTTLLTTGKILVAGGTNAGTVLGSSEVYDPATGIWTVSGNLSQARQNHTATLLPNGTVLVTGGADSAGNSLASAEIFNLATGKWTVTGSLSQARQNHTATLLPNGTVLVAGGSNNATALAGSEIFNPASSSWTTVGNLNAARSRQTATLLPDGTVLVAGGSNNATALASSEIYSPASSSWTTAGSLATSRQNHSSTLLTTGKVLVVGGLNNSAPLGTAELYDPATNSWSPTGNLNAARQNHTATLLPDGKLLVIAGYSSAYLRSSELYDPVSASWTTGYNINTTRAEHTTTFLPTGQLLVVGGVNSNGSTAGSELYDATSGKWTGVGNSLSQRYAPTTTLLPNGKVLIAGGAVSSSSASSEIYDPATGTSIATGDLNRPRNYHTATLLPNGKVLVAGGYDNTAPSNNTLDGSEIYDPATGQWTPTGNLNYPRQMHVAVLLGNGKVLVMSGYNSTGNINSSEIYDPATGQWTPTGNMIHARYQFTATLLRNGKVLATGGHSPDGGVFTSSSELYDPATGQWTPTGNTTTVRTLHVATLLPNGKVLVTGGIQSVDIVLNETELYDPATGIWTAASPTRAPRQYHSATVLPNGKVLVAGGDYSNKPGDEGSTFEEIYNPATDKWTGLSNYNTARNPNIIGGLLLANGKVLTAGGLFDPGQDFSPSLQPQINSVSPIIYPGSKVPITIEGTGFASKTEASGGATNSSPTNYPVIRLQSLSNGQVAWPPVQSWSATNITLTAPLTFPPGAAFLSVYVNGVPGYSGQLMISPPLNTATSLTFSPIAPIAGDNIMFSATVSTTEASPVGAPTGNVSFKLNGVAVGSGLLNPAGVATYTYSSPFVYTGTLAAEYTPLSGFQASVSATQPFTISAPLPNPLALYPASAVLASEQAGFHITIRAEKVITSPTTGKWATEVYCQKPDGSANMLIPEPYNPTTPDLIEATFNLACFPNSPGIVKIYLKNPEPGGGSSIALPFEFTAQATNPVPTIVKISPDYLLVGATGNPKITISAQNIHSGVVIYYNGKRQTTTRENSQSVYFNMSANDLTNPGIGVIQIENPAPGGGYSNVAVLKVIPATYSQPVITSLSPGSITKGGPEFPLVVYGQNFYANSQVLWNGSPRTTTYYSPTLLIADIGHGDITESGTVTVTVATGPQLSMPATIEVVSQCLFNVVTKFEDSLETNPECGTLRAAVKYTSGGSFGALYVWGGSRQAARSFTLNAPLDMSKVSTFFPCGLDGKPQYEIESKIQSGINQPAVLINNLNRPVGALIPYLQGIRLKGTGAPLLRIQGALKTGCLQVIK